MSWPTEQETYIREAEDARIRELIHEDDKKRESKAAMDPWWDTPLSQLCPIVFQEIKELGPCGKIWVAPKPDYKWTDSVGDYHPGQNPVWKAPKLARRRKARKQMYQRPASASSNSLSGGSTSSSSSSDRV